jgi:hypothetical protein
MTSQALQCHIMLRCKIHTLSSISTHAPHPRATTIKKRLKPNRKSPTEELWLSVAHERAKRVRHHTDCTRSACRCTAGLATAVIGRLCGADEASDVIQCCAKHPRDVHLLRWVLAAWVSRADDQLNRTGRIRHLDPPLVAHVELATRGRVRGTRSEHVDRISGRLQYANRAGPGAAMP